MSHEKKSPSQEPRFQARRESINEEVQGGDHGGTEMGWLVSYADMMTLLFGLFVVLFSIKVDGKRGVDDVMREVSNKYFSVHDQEVNDSKLLKSSEPVDQSLTTNESVESIERVESLQTSLEEKKIEIEKLNTEHEKLVESLKKENKELTSKFESANRKIASVGAKESEANKQMQGEIEDLREELQKMESALKAKDEEIHKHKSPHQNYMMTLVTWDTEKHDVDLKVVTPNKKSFNFKRRTIPSEPGKFELDSRYGPGIEMWKAENFVTGSYTANISLYNRNGNEEDASIQFTVVTNLGTYKSSKIVLNSQKMQENLTFEVDSQGAVQFGK